MSDVPDTFDPIEYKRRYKGAGFSPLPLQFNSKEPYPGTKLNNGVLGDFLEESNIGLFAGSENDFTVLDADDDKTVKRVKDVLQGLGLLQWTTVVITPRRHGRHFWFRVASIPDHAQAYYKLIPRFGKGEFRVKAPAYVVAPYSKLNEGTYMFEQGGIEFFNLQPLLGWRDLLWLLPTHAFSPNGNGGNGDIQLNRLGLPYKPEPPILAMFEILRTTPPGEPVQRVNWYNGNSRKGVYQSRSEAEMALVAGLIRAGWGYDQIERVFEEERPSHYMHTKYRYKYLQLTYTRALRLAEEEYQKLYEKYKST